MALDLGVPLIVSHMFVFYFGIMADLTPPVALACFAAAPIAKEKGLKFAALQKQLEPLRLKLKAQRDRRERPLTDTKILTSWNGLMIRGMADTGRILKQKKYLTAAERAADFLNTHLRDSKGRLLRTHRKGTSKLNAYLDDYAFYIDGLIALHQATGDQNRCYQGRARGCHLRDPMPETALVKRN